MFYVFAKTFCISHVNIKNQRILRIYILQSKTFLYAYMHRSGGYGNQASYAGSIYHCLAQCLEKSRHGLLGEQ